MIAVLVSGGIDSLVAAYLLKQEYNDVVGLHLLTGYNEMDKASRQCLSRQAGMPVEVLDCRKTFENTVIAYFLEAYLRGETPNPCMRCNAAIKFGIGLDYARQMGADNVATGHYCRRTENNQEAALARGADRQKEQSYFLGFLSPGKIRRACFPLGNMDKQQVQALAREKKLVPVIKKESQDVCFIKKNTSCADFIEGRLSRPPAAGPIEDLEGNIIGTHPGIHRFTIGQRRGINCPARRPYYVADIDAHRNRVRVGTREQVLVPGCRVRHINWLRRPEAGPMDCHVKVRYQHPAVLSKLVPEADDQAQVVFRKPQFGVTPGQAAVFYDQETVVGGGIIVR